MWDDFWTPPLTPILLLEGTLWMHLFNDFIINVGNFKTYFHYYLFYNLTLNVGTLGVLTEKRKFIFIWIKKIMKGFSNHKTLICGFLNSYIQCYFNFKTIKNNAFMNISVLKILLHWLTFLELRVEFMNTPNISNQIVQCDTARTTPHRQR